MRIKESDIVLLIIVLIIIISYIFIKIFTYRSEPLLMDYAKRKSNNIVSSIINKSINEIIYNNYDNIIKIDKDNNGNITNLNFDNKKINEILYLTTNDLLNSIKKLENGEFDNLDLEYLSNNDKVYYVPIGIIHNIPILINIGPKIPFKIEVLSSINNSSYTNIKEYGINSSIVEVFIKIEIQIQVILPFKSEILNIEKNVLLDSKIIQGKIPNYYGGLLSTSLK